MNCEMFKTKTVPGGAGTVKRLDQANNSGKAGVNV